MIYTSGIIRDLTIEESLEQLQDNKLTVVCEKVPVSFDQHVLLLITFCSQLDLQPEDHLLDIGCGWGTLSAFAHKNYGCKVTGITLAKNQTAFGNERIKANVRCVSDIVFN